MANPTVIWEHRDPNGTRGRRLTLTGGGLVYEEFQVKAALGEPLWTREPLSFLPPGALDALAARVQSKPEDEVLAEQALARAVGLSGHHRVTILERTVQLIEGLRKTERAAVDDAACVRGEVATLSRDLDTARRELEAWKASRPIERNRQLEIFVSAVHEVLGQSERLAALDRTRLHASATMLINQRSGPLPRRKLLPKGSARVVKAAREWLWVTPKPSTDEECALRDAVLALPPEAP